MGCQVHVHTVALNHKVCYLMRNVTFFSELYYNIIVCELHTYIQYMYNVMNGQKLNQSVSSVYKTSYLYTTMCMSIWSSTCIV